MAPGASAQERQTLALIYGLQGSVAEAARLGRIDLDEASVEHNLAYYQTLRELPPEARDRAILSTAGNRRRAAAVLIERFDRVGGAQCLVNVSMMLIAAGPSRTMNNVGRMNTIIGTVSSAGSRAAFSSARVIRAARDLVRQDAQRLGQRRAELGGLLQGVDHCPDRVRIGAAVEIFERQSGGPAKRSIRRR